MKRYAEFGKIFFEDVGGSEECDHIWAAVGIVLGVVGVLILVFIANIRLIDVRGGDGRQTWRSPPRTS